MAWRRNAVHAGGVNPVEMHRVWMRAIVLEDDAKPVSFGRTQRRAWDATVEGPRGEHDPRCDLDFLFLRRHFIGAQPAPVWKRRHFCAVPIRQHGRRIETVPIVVDIADGDHRPVGRRVMGYRPGVSSPGLVGSMGSMGTMGTMALRPSRLSERPTSADSGPACGEKTGTKEPPAIEIEWQPTAHH